MGKALVLGGGGIAGLAWEIGILAGLRDMGVDLRDADLVLGTSAGASAGAQLTSGIELDELYERQLAPADAEIAARPRWSAAVRVAGALLTARSPEAGRARAGLVAASSARFSQAVRERVIASRLPAHAWPEHNLVLTAVDARSGTLRTFSRNDGVDLVRAVAASSAVPGLWPPVDIDGRWYIDASVRSATNADLAAGHERVVVLAPTAGAGPLLCPGPEPAGLPEGARGALVTPSTEARAAFGRDPLNPAGRARAAQAGRLQAVEVAVRVAKTWGV
ncbi:patatin-like phospholipase family protein [Thermobifida halotolerans]|uniref:Patatin-like phospholipase family protein n=1 Tax=Thermobifida halotolerans TaxID=483545 RepID=A0A399G080_9ACTN|nr:patatin-like phospholipase family protein [Thermobifida halotolerans]UOE19554.1 patatin-like phospholipase family protein [Thermobifida halotolerans]